MQDLHRLKRLRPHAAIPWYPLAHANGSRRFRCGFLRSDNDDQRLARDWARPRGEHQRNWRCMEWSLRSKSMVGIIGVGRNSRRNCCSHLRSFANTSDIFRFIFRLLIVLWFLVVGSSIGCPFNVTRLRFVNCCFPLRMKRLTGLSWLFSFFWILIPSVFVDPRLLWLGLDVRRPS